MAGVCPRLLRGTPSGVNARQLGIDGRSQMNKAELQRAVDERKR